MNFTMNFIVDDEKEYEQNVKCLYESIYNNEQEIDLLEEEISLLKKRLHEIKPIGPKKQKEKKEKIKKKYEAKEVSISYYLELLDLAENIQDLEEFMPKEGDKEYRDVAYSLLMYLQKEAVFFHKMMTFTNEKSELEDIKRELLTIERKKSFVNEYMKKVDHSVEISKDDIHIFYTTTARGNVKLLNDIKKIPSEEYDTFSVLFQSIQSGNFKNPKVIKSSNRFYGKPFLEVKLNCARITFEILTRDIVVITGAFVKKVQTSKKYDMTMIHNKQLFLNNKDYLMKNSKCKAFLRRERG